MTVLVKKLGGSVAVVIPKTVAREMNLVDGTALDLTASAGSIIMRPRHRRARRPLKEIVAQMKPISYRRRRKEFPDDGPIGREFW